MLEISEMNTGDPGDRATDTGADGQMSANREETAIKAHKEFLTHGLDT